MIRLQTVKKTALQDGGGFFRLSKLLLDDPKNEMADQTYPGAFLKNKF